MPASAPSMRPEVTARPSSESVDIGMTTFEMSCAKSNPVCCTPSSLLARTANSATRENSRTRPSNSAVNASAIVLERSSALNTVSSSSSGSVMHESACSRMVLACSSRISSSVRSNWFDAVASSSSAASKRSRASWSSARNASFHARVSCSSLWSASVWAPTTLTKRAASSALSVAAQACNEEKSLPFGSIKSALTAQTKSGARIRHRRSRNPSAEGST